MNPTRRTQLIAAAVIVALIAAYFAYTAYQKRVLKQNITELVSDTGARLGKALEIHADASAPDAAAAQARIDEHLATVERHLTNLRGLAAAPVRPLADAADEYVHTSVEILRRKAAAHGHRLQLALSTQALREHMTTDKGSTAWITGAIRAKERMDRDHREYRRAAEALASLLGEYSISRRRMSEHVDAALLPEDSVAEAARSRALDTMKEIGEEIAQVGRLDAYR